MELRSLFEQVVDIAPGDQVLERLPTHGGVYLLTDASDRLIQLAASADLRRALRHRLGTGAPPPPAQGGEAAPEPVTDPAGTIEAAQDQEAGEPEIANQTKASDGKGGVAAGSPRPRVNLAEIVRRIWWRPAYSQFELTFAYYQIARVLMPRTYRRQVGFGPAWFVHVDPDARLPQFASGKFLRSPPGVDLGPFATQSDAARFIEILQETFDLCRFHHILEQAPHGQACAYFEMGKCPAPCDGSIPLERYREMIAAALRFACGEREPAYREIEAAMRGAAAAQQYERAGAFKKRLERARGIEHAAFARVGPMDRFDLLILQRGTGTTSVRPFFVRAGAITADTQVKLKEVPGVLDTWREMLRQPPEALDATQRSEHVWLVSHFLFKPETPGLYLSPAQLSDPEALMSLIEARFSSRRSHKADRATLNYKAVGSSEHEFDE